MAENIHFDDNEEQPLSEEELQALEDDILNEAAGGTNAPPISPNIGC
ncbi:hypothetical protein [Thalassomonas sp. RHCl1]|nr:hypothetical protein [Thalassomonas sp. RHCl1]